MNCTNKEITEEVKDRLQPFLTIKEVGSPESYKSILTAEKQIVMEMPWQPAIDIDAFIQGVEPPFKTGYGSATVFVDQNGSGSQISFANGSGYRVWRLWTSSEAVFNAQLYTGLFDTMWL